MTRAELISLLNADLRRERMHLNFYLYHASAVSGLHALELREFLIEAAKGEMAHVLAFQDRLYGLGCIAWPGFGNTVDQAADAFMQFTAPADILRQAEAMERDVVTNYTQRLAQLEGSSLPEAAYMKVFYEDQLQDSYEDCERIRRILAG